MEEANEGNMAQMIVERIKEGAFLVVQAGDRMNVMTIGWAMFGYVWRRSTMMIAIRKSRFTHGLIEQADSFTVNVPTANMGKEINLCGTKSGRDCNKFREGHLSTIKAKQVTSPILKIPGYHYECRIICKAPMDPKLISTDLEQLYPAKDYHTLYFGEILASYQTE